VEFCIWKSTLRLCTRDTGKKKTSGLVDRWVKNGKQFSTHIKELVSEYVGAYKSPKNVSGTF